MTGVSVKEALATHGFEESRVVAGRSGLDNIVKTVTVAEVPDAMDWLNGGELVITTAYYIKDDPLALKNWVQGLVDHGAVALAIKPERFIGTIPDAIKQIGDELSFPIIELPARVTWPVIIEGVMNLILDREAEGRLKADLLRTLMEESDEEEIKYKAGAQGFDFSGLLTTVIIRLYKQEDNPVQSINAFLTKTIHHLAEQLDPKVFSIPRQDGLILFLHSYNGKNDEFIKRVKGLAINIIKALEQNLCGYKPIIGIGNSYERIKDIKKSYAEALEAVNTAKKFPSYGQVICFAEMGCYRLLSMVRDRSVLEAYCQDTIGTLVEYEKENQVNLLETLENFLICNGNQADVARKMFLHVNTVAYRLNRIKELLGVDLSQAETRFNLYLALKILENTK